LAQRAELLLAVACMAGCGAAAWASSRAARRPQEEESGARQRFLAGSAGRVPACLVCIRLGCGTPAASAQGWVMALFTVGISVFTGLGSSGAMQ